MGTVTLAGFREELVNALGRGTISTTLIDRWVHAAYVEVAYGFKFREFEAVYVGSFVNGVGTLAPPADFRAFHEEGVWITSPDYRVGRMMIESRSQYLREVDRLTTSTYGAPSHMSIFGEMLYVRPYPDDILTAYELHYWKKVTALTLEGHTSQLDDDFDDILLTGALWRGHRHFGEHDRYFNVRNDFLGQLRTRMDRYDLEPFPEGGISVARHTDAPEDYQRG